MTAPAADAVAAEIAKQLAQGATFLTYTVTVAPSGGRIGVDNGSGTLSIRYQDTLVAAVGDNVLVMKQGTVRIAVWRLA